MGARYFSTPRLAGLLLLLSVLLLLVGATTLAAEGRLPGMGAAFRGVGPGRTDASGLRDIGRFALPFILLQLAGFAVFTTQLREAGDAGLALAALALLVFAMAFATLEGSFHANLTVWAVQVARTGAVPDFYEPLRRWLNGDVQIIYVSAFQTAMLLYSLSALSTRLAPSWLGWAALATTLLSVWHYFFVLGAPAVIFATPLLFGVGLLRARTTSRDSMLKGDPQ
jgi:hypothetical protein